MACQNGSPKGVTSKAVGRSVKMTVDEILNVLNRRINKGIWRTESPVTASNLDVR